MRDDKFLDYYIAMSERFIPNETSYVIFKDTDELVHIKNKTVPLIILKESSDNFDELVASLSKTNVIVFHSFNERWFNFIRSIPKGLKKVWLFWGFEGYAALPKPTFPSMSVKIAKYENNFSGNVRFLYSCFRRIFINKNHLEAREIINVMDYCATWVDADHALAKTINPYLKNLSFNYYTKELMDFESFDVQRLNRNKLLLGNSADPSNNHIDALQFLHKNKFKGIIYCPLSYGGTKLYREYICKLGNKYFGSNFKPLVEFMPLNEYQLIVNECGIVWMNHKRQQAAGNLLFSFLAKKIVVLNSVSPLIDTFDKWNLKHFNRNNFEMANSNLEADLEKNRKIILERITIDQNETFFRSIEKLALGK
ncbi:hypothetical protein IWX76_003193 [Pedobacter sp. CAN_A7]